MANSQSTGGYTRKEVVQAVGLIAVSLRRFVHDAEQHLSGREIERLIQAAQLLETLNER